MRPLTASLTRDCLIETTRRCRALTANIFPNLSSRSNFAQAAVIIPLLQDPETNEPIFLFEQRSRNLRHHSGEVCFPGGFVTEDDKGSSWIAACREAREELGWTIKEECLVGDLGEWLNRKSQVRVTPYLVWDSTLRPNQQLQANPAEVEHFFMVPLKVLNDWNKKEYKRLHPTWPPVPFFYPDDDHVIWGFTGFVLDAFLRELANSSSSSSP